MTRTGVMASSRPHKDGAVSLDVMSAGMLRRLSTISAVLLLALALLLPASALAAAEPTSNYGSTPTTPTTTSKSGTAPSKEASEPSKTTAPATTGTTSPETAKSTLPFTGFDLRWSLAIGVLLIAGGFTIVAMQRRQRSDS